MAESLQLTQNMTKLPEFGQDITNHQLLTDS